MNSILSFPDRGHYGKNNYRGNCSGYVIKELIEHFSPQRFIDACMGSGTTMDVCQELNIAYVGLDLFHNFDMSQDSLLWNAGGPGDMVFSHPPYFDMIDYHLERQKHGYKTSESVNDLSKCENVDEYIYRCHKMLINQREATIAGGTYVTLIGDYRKNGKFYSFQSDFIQAMPKSELLSVTIKLQHNCLSNTKKYASSNFVPIQHEYLIIWKKTKKSLFDFIEEKKAEYHKQFKRTWRCVVEIALVNLGTKASLSEIYSEVRKVAKDKVEANKHFRAKIRQTLQLHFENVEKGVWAVQ